MKYRILIFIFFIAAGTLIFAQEADTSKIRNNKSDEDTSWNQDEDWSKWEKDWDKEWNKWDSEFGHFRFKGRPSISINYGFSKLGLKDIKGTFADPGSIELKLGYVDERVIKKESNLLDYETHFFHVGNINSDLGKAASTELSSNNWRFGFGSSEGYGYKMGNSAVLLNHGFSLDWTRMDVKGSNVPLDSAQLSMYNKSFRFGTSWTGNIEIRIIPQLAVDASYERSIIFKRHLFWKWAGSVVVETAGQFLITQFVDEILDSSPYAAPIVNFVLKNALSYGIYELRKDKMNWPFETPSPLTADQFKVGFTFVF